jgi:hypothetical protein
MMIAQWGKSETSSTSKDFEVRREYMGVRREYMGVRREYEGSTWEYKRSTWEYKGSTWEYKGSTKGVQGSTKGVRREYGSTEVSLFPPCDRVTIFSGRDVICERNLLVVSLNPMHFDIIV